MVEAFLKVVLPLALVVMMFGMGLQLRGGDFLRLARFPKAVLAGMLTQLVLLPSIAFLLVHFLSLPLAISAGIVILAACPGGVASNAFSFLARADVALSVTLTALSSVVALVSLPLIVAVGLEIIQLGSAEISHQDAIELPLRPTVQQLLIVILLPLSAGMLVRRFAERLALNAARWVAVVSMVVLVVLLAGAFIVGLDFLVKNFALILPVLLALNLASMLGAYLLAQAFGLVTPQRLTITIDTGIHNVGLGILVALNVLQQPDWIVAPSVYAILMMLSTFALIAGLRLQRDKRAPAAS
jgi:bile acid:Na+ symporter, BASS family